MKQQKKKIKVAKLDPVNPVEDWKVTFYIFH